MKFEKNSIFFSDAPKKVFHMKGPPEKILYLLLIRFTFAFAILDFGNADRYVCVALLTLSDADLFWLQKWV